MSTGVRDLKVWQESVALAGDVIRVTRTSVRRETKSVTDTVMGTAMSIGAHIADGYCAYGPAEQRDAYLMAKRALYRLETELAALRHADLIPQAAFTDLANRSGTVSRLLVGYIAYLDRQLSEQAGKARVSQG